MIKLAGEMSAIGPKRTSLHPQFAMHHRGRAHGHDYGRPPE